MRPGGVIHLTKHHGAGNDFLVHLDPSGARRLDRREVAALCDRHLGVGADGLLHLAGGDAGADVAMELRNADGAPAEMSGNGIRCLVQAAVLGGLARPGTVRVRTAAGVRVVDYRPGDDPGLGHAAVDMGPVVLGAEPVPAELAVPDLRRARRVDVGNPHLVLLFDPLPGDGPAPARWAGPDTGAAPDGDAVAPLGGRLERAVPGGANVEFVRPGPGPAALTMRVWERGVGETLACGTGSCAAAAAAHAWGIAPARVTVVNPGGPLEVELADGSARLAGPTRLVARVEIDEAVLAGMVAAATAGVRPPVVAGGARRP